MGGAARLFVYLVIVFHVLAFVAEALLWMNPAIYAPAVSKLNSGLQASALDQAAILQTLFINQGFYNLFLALGGLTGLVLIRRGSHTAGEALVCYCCAFAVCAGIVLLLTTKAYAGFALQTGLGATALALMYRDHLRRQSAQ